MHTQLQHSCKVQVVDHIYPQFYEYIEERTETVLLGEGGGVFLYNVVRPYMKEG